MQDLGLSPNLPASLFKWFSPPGRAFGRTEAVTEFGSLSSPQRRVSSAKCLGASRYGVVSVTFTYLVPYRLTLLNSIETFGRRLKTEAGALQDRR